MQRPVGIIGDDVKDFPPFWSHGSQQGHCVVERFGRPHPRFLPIGGQDWRVRVSPGKVLQLSGACWA